MRKEGILNREQYCTFYIVRHGQTDWNAKKLTQGQTDIDLNATGENEARQLALRLNPISFDCAFSSDLLRAKRTAELITLEKKLAVTTTKALRERNFGKYEGKPYQEFRAEIKELLIKYEQLSEKEKSSFRFAEDVETDEELVARFNTFLREVAVAYRSKHILMVTHGSMMRTLLIHMGFTSYKEIDNFTIKNTAYFKLLSDGIDFFIEETFGIEKKED